MSTKIYGGAFLPKMNATQLVEWCKKFKKKADKVKSIEILKCFAESCTYGIDNACMTSSEPVDVKKLRSQLWGKFTDEIMKNDVGIRHPWSDFATSAVFFPMKNKTLSIFYADNEAMWSLWKKNTKDYHYQNQTDYPKEITAKQWAQRRKDWDKVLSDDGIPSHNGLSFTFTDNKDIFFALNE